MGEDLEHKCGVAFIRLLKPYSYYVEKYDDEHILLNLMYLLLLRQRNRGQDAAGIGTCYIPYTERLDNEYMFKDKMISKDPVQDLYDELMEVHNDGGRIADERKGNVMIGHTLYPTFLREADYRFVHPVEERSGWPTRRIMIAMNGNFANNREQRDFLRRIGQWPTATSDMATLIEKMGYYLGEEHDRHYRLGKSTEDISRDLDISQVMRKVNEKVRGAFSIVGIVGNGDAFFARDPHGIRPLHYFVDEDFIVAASEVSAIASTFMRFGTKIEDIKDMEPGHMMIVKNFGAVEIKRFADETSNRPCQFESVYFSRPNNPDVYNSRKTLGKLLAPIVKKTIVKKTGGDPNRIVLSYVPNTSESAAIGMFQELTDLRAEDNVTEILKLIERGELTGERLECLLRSDVKYEKALTKDAKLRTFIAQQDIRRQMVISAYDPVADVADNPEIKKIIKVEDSVVKGNTLEHNVILTLAISGYEDIYVVSSEPQVRYICCYGIEMSRLDELIAFRAAIELMKDKGLEHELKDIKERALVLQEMINKDQNFRPPNLVSEIYSFSTYDEISDKVGQLVTPKIEGRNVRVTVIYSTHDMLKAALGRGDNLCMACLNGEYPEIGGARIINKALINYFDSKDEPAY